MKNDSFRQTAEKLHDKIGRILRGAPYTIEPLEEVTTCIIQTIRAEAKRAFSSGYDKGFEVGKSFCKARTSMDDREIRAIAEKGAKQLGYKPYEEGANILELLIRHGDK